ncbi:MAG TPA: ATP-binding protein [Streptosporangiaceae bacterium]|nr:ATP-binding protein [Streptosporangiaceae bacterium]
MRNRRNLGIGQLGRRLALAFVAVALAAIGVLALISAATTNQEINKLVTRQERNLAGAVAVATGAAHDPVGWARDGLMPVFDLVAMDHASVQVRDMRGKVVRSSTGFAGMPPAHQLIEPVRAGGHRVGTVTVRFGGNGLGGAAGAFEAKRWRARLIAAGIAALLALVVSLAVARAITGPLELLLEAVRARGSGMRSVRIRRVRGSGVVRELLESFNQSTDSLDQQERLRRNLVADVAHELRTPVAVLQASHEAMLDGVTDPTRQNLESLREEVLRLARIVEDLQRLAAAESAALQLTLAPHDLAAIAAEAADRLRGAYGAAEVGFVQRLTEVHIACDADRMREVISNLLTNALKFTHRRGRVRLETGAREDGLATLRITDTGIGILAHELPHVTERFFRGLHAPEMAGGSGIGLTIVAELVHAHGGELDIASEPGRGTQVTLTLPAVDAAETRRLALLRSAAQSL